MEAFDSSIFPRQRASSRSRHHPKGRPNHGSGTDGYTHRLLPTTARSGSARASPVPVPTFCPSHSPYPGGFLSACNSRSSAPSVAFAVISAARHPLVPLAGVSLTRLQDSRHAAGWTVAPPEGAFDTALRRRAFPPDAGSLLPGLLAATPDRTHTGWRTRACAWTTSTRPPRKVTSRRAPTLLGSRNPR